MSQLNVEGISDTPLYDIILIFSGRDLSSERKPVLMLMLYSACGIDKDQFDWSLTILNPYNKP